MNKSLSAQKYFVNQLIFWVAVSLIIYCYSNLFKLRLELKFESIFLIGINLTALTLSLHYLMNVLHQASHNLLSRNRHWNIFFGHTSAILTGLTFSEFRLTHSMHHANLGDSNKDPDYKLTHSGTLLTLPFRIWQKDVYFWKNKLYKKNKAWKGYLIDRALQILLVLLIFVFKNQTAYFSYWLIAVLTVGYLNGLFLFYFPHYSTKWEKLNQQKTKVNIITKLILTFINISRFYHHKHHDKTNDNTVYFPLENYLYSHFTNPKFILPKTNKKYLV